MKGYRRYQQGGNFWTPYKGREGKARLQRMLINLGLLDEGEDDGILGRKTGNAVRMFQEKLSLPKTGILDRDTINELETQYKRFNQDKGGSQTQQAARVTPGKMNQKYYPNPIMNPMSSGTMSDQLMMPGYMGGGHYNPMGMFTPRNQAALTMMASPLTGIQTNRNITTYPKVMDGGSIVSMLMQAKYRPDYMSIPGELNPYALTGALSKAQYGGMMYQMGGGMPGMEQPQMAPMAPGQEMMPQGPAGPPNPSQQRMEELTGTDPNSGNQIPDQALVQLAMRLMQGDPEAQKLVQQLPPEAQQKLLQIMQQMDQQGAGQLPQGPEGAEGPMTGESVQPPAMKKGGNMRKKRRMRKASMMSYAKGGLFSPKTGEAGEAYVQKLINKTVGTIPKKTFKDPKYVGYKPKYKF